MAAKILLLEDEVNVGSTLRDRLQIEGYEISWAQNVQAAQTFLTELHFPLAILDVNLPDGNGYDVAKLIRDRYASTAVVFLTASGTPEDRIHGLELGAEDYIVKPFHFKELLLRIQKVLQRAHFIQASGQEPIEVRVGRAAIRFQQYQIVVDSKIQTLTHKECALLKLLWEKRGQVVSRDEILNIVWSEDEYPTPRTIDNFILKLRKWIEPDPENPTLIRSVRGVGYLLEMLS
jgi:two-component system alkaline phosphatase synthesis response regulator PhoP